MLDESYFNNDGLVFFNQDYLVFQPLIIILSLYASNYVILIAWISIGLITLAPKLLHFNAARLGRLGQNFNQLVLG